MSHPFLNNSTNPLQNTSEALVLQELQKVAEEKRVLFTASLRNFERTFLHNPQSNDYEKNEKAHKSEYVHKSGATAPFLTNASGHKESNFAFGKLIVPYLVIGIGVYSLTRCRYNKHITRLGKLIVHSVSSAITNEEKTCGESRSMLQSPEHLHKANKGTTLVGIAMQLATPLLIEYVQRAIAQRSNEK